MASSDRNPYDDNNKFGKDIQTNRARPLYADYWDVDIDSIIEVDKEADDGNELAELLDKGGIDKIVKIPADNIHLAQRFRRPRWNDPDFTIRRYPDGFDVEYGKLRNRFERGGGYPTRYAWGHARPEKGFYSFYIIDMTKFLELEFSGDLEKVPCYKNGRDEDPFLWKTSGPKPWGFYAWKWDVLEDAGCILAKYDSGTLGSTTESEPKPRQISINTFADGGRSCDNCGYPLGNPQRICPRCNADQGGDFL